VYNPSHFCFLHAAADETTVIPDPEERSTLLVTCECCGAEFEAKRTSRRYCSSRCRMAAYQARQRTVDAEPRLCGRI
jgi:hypothetical protein